MTFDIKHLKTAHHICSQNPQNTFYCSSFYVSDKTKQEDYCSTCQEFLSYDKSFIIMIWCCQFVIGFPRCCVAPGNAPDAKNRLRMTIVTMLKRKVTIVTKSRTKWLPRVENVRGTGHTKITMTRTMFTGLPTPANLWEGSFLLDHKFHWIIKRTEWRVNKDIGTFQIGARQIIISSSDPHSNRDRKIDWRKYWDRLG